MRHPFFFFVVLPLAHACVTPSHPSLLLDEPRAPRALVFRDVRVFTATTLDALEHHDVLVMGERIVLVAPTGDALPDDAEIIDGRGRTLLPGFVDMHVHLALTPDPPWTFHSPGPEVMGRALLWAGITTAFDAAGPLDLLADAQRHFDDGTWPGPSLVFTGPIVTHEDAYPASVAQVLPWPLSSAFRERFATEVTSARAIHDAMDLRKASGATFVKIAVANNPLDSPAFSDDEIVPVVRAAHARGLRVVAHIDTAAHALAAVRAGVDGLVHSVHIGALGVDDARVIATHRTPVAPTLVAFDHHDRVNDATWSATAMDREVWAPELVDAFDAASMREHKSPEPFRPWMERLHADAALRREAVRRLYEAGVPLMVGSDTGGAPASYPGSTFHEEMRLMVDAGVPAPVVLRAATHGGAAFLGAARKGTIADGQRADLVLVDGNPLEDIAATERIVVVMKGGRVVRDESSL